MQAKEKEKDDFSLYSYGEGRTALGQLVQFTCRPDEQETIRTFLDENVRTVREMVTHQNVAHGGYGAYTRYDIQQHHYAAGDGEDGSYAYIELLEIKDAPDGRCGFVIHENSNVAPCRFTEWTSLEAAKAAWEKYYSSRKKEEVFSKLPGFIRMVACEGVRPWFYAIGNEELIGDYTLPNHLNDDPVYRLGQKFLVFNKDGVPMVRTCMGCRFVETKDRNHPYHTTHKRLVYWNDGTVWDEGETNISSTYQPPRLLLQEELWVEEAVHQFRVLLAGKQEQFSLDFTDGTKFVGKITSTKHKNPCAEGSYNLSVIVQGEEKPRVGWVKDFVPTPEFPDIVTYATRRMKGSVERVEILESKVVPGGKKWSGVFHAPPKKTEA